MIKILLVEDCPIVREGLERILNDSPGVTVAGRAGNGAEAVALVAAAEFEVVVLDISTSGKSGFGIFHQLKQAISELRILILDLGDEGQHVLPIMRANAFGYLTRESTSEELIAAIRKAATGEKHIGPALAARLALDLTEEESVPLHHLLSKRELQAMIMIASGKTGKDIAKSMSLSPKTVSTFRKRILAKMNMKSDAEIVRYALRQGLVT